LEKVKDVGVEKLVKNLFPVSDTINVCLQNQPNFSIDTNPGAQVAFDALATAKHQFLAIFRESYGFEEFMPELGETFDPMLHNALLEVDPPEKNPNIPPGTIGRTIISGWKLKHNLMRAASVGVVKQIPKKELPQNLKDKLKNLEKEEKEEKEGEDDEDDGLSFTEEEKIKIQPKK